MKVIERWERAETEVLRAASPAPRSSQLVDGEGDIPVGSEFSTSDINWAS